MQKKKKIFGKIVLLSILLCLVVTIVVGVFLINRHFPLHYVNIVNEHAEMFDLDPELIFAVIHAESRFNSNAVSRVGASGLMQIMEPTAYWLAPQIGLENFCYETQIFDPAINILIGTFYLRMLISRFDCVEVALAAYNAGTGRVNGWLSNPDYSIDGITLDYIPFSETRNYVDRVAFNQRIYRIMLKFSNPQIYSESQQTTYTPHLG